MYRVYDASRDLFTEFENYTQLVNYLSGFNHFCGTEYSNSFLDRTGNNPNDTYRAYILRPFTLSCEGFDPETRIYSDYRRNRVYDDWRSIYGAELIRDVRNWKYREDVAKQHREFIRQRREPSKSERRWRRYQYDCPEFRRGPWPGIRNHYRYSHFYRAPKLFNERRNTAYKEMEPFNRGSRGKNLPDPWDEEPVRDWRNHGWKSQGKRKHQWENGVICREKHQYGKGVFVLQETPWDDLDDAV